MSNVISVVTVETIKAKIEQLKQHQYTWHAFMTTRYQTMGFHTFDEAIECNDFIADPTYMSWRDYTIEISILERLIKD